LTDEQEKTAPIELPQQSAAAVAPGPGTVEAPPLEPSPAEAAVVEQTPAPVSRAVGPGQREVMFVPLAVSIGDGFKFGCGFFMAMVLAMLVGFVLLALLFVLTSLFGLNLPIAR
jgi:hypothetical protein